MSHRNTGAPARHILLGAVLSLLLGVAPGCAKRQGPTSPASTSTAPCGRSVDGDIETARRRLEAARPTEAALYIEGLAACEEARQSTDYMLLAMDVFEELGRLNEAWSALRVALDLTAEADEDGAAIHRRIEDFSSRYVFLSTPGDARRPPNVSYAGPMLDAAIQGQLSNIEEQRGTWRQDGRYGYWMYPGRYQIDGVELTVRPGQELQAPGRGRRQ